MSEITDTITVQENQAAVRTVALTGTPEKISATDVKTIVDGQAAIKVCNLGGGGGGSSLPNQTGNAGKFLTTDGTNASWGGGYCAGSKSYVDYATVVLDAKNYVSNFDSASVVISPTSRGTPQDLSTTIFAHMGGITSVGIGFGAYASGSNAVSVGGISSAKAPDALAIGYSAAATASGAIQLGGGTNSASSTLQVFDKQLMDANGYIPAERLASDGTTGQVLSKTDAGMEWKTVSGGGDYLPLSGGVMTGPIRFSFSGSSLYEPRISNNANDIQIGTSFKPEMFVFDLSTTGILRPGGYSSDLGNRTYKWRRIYGQKLNNGEDIAVPTTGGTMVVATPPTAAGNYVLKATVAEDGTVTTQWVAEA